MSLTRAASYHQASDQELMEHFRQSLDQDALAAFYQRYQPLIFGTCVKYLKDSDDAADASADIYGELVQKVPKYQIDQPKAWLYMLTKNHCLQRLRKQKGHAEAPFSEDFMQSPDDFNLESIQVKEQQLNTLQGCIDSLKEEQRKAVSLFYLEEKCYDQIAELTGLPWNTVRSHLQNGRRNLKLCMEQKHA